MSDYISREAALEALQNPELFNVSPRFLQILRNLPAADVELVRHGRWMDIPNAYVSVASKNGAYHGNATACSECHEINPNAYKTNYCPICGAKMDLEDETNDD